MIFELTVLGCNSAVPMHDRHPSAQVLNHNHKPYLIDCGESTQFQLRKYKVKYSKIDHIFISHLHGDHYFGLIALISSYHLMGRQNALYIYGPQALEQIICIQLEASKTRLRFPIFFIKTTNAITKIYENKEIEVYTIPLLHRITTTGFLFREKTGERHINKEKIKNIELSPTHFKALRNGEDIIVGQKTYKNETLTSAPTPTRSYAYCSDTAFNPEMIKQLKNVDLLYHEATFDKSNQQRAADTLHSTTKDAGTIASKAGVGQLIIGHYSSRYKELEPLRSETCQFFANTLLAQEGKTYPIG